MSMRRLSMYGWLAAAVVLAAVGAACGRGLFEDRTLQLGLEPGNGPAAWVDYDNDGWVDIYCGGKLWRNEGGKRFSKVLDKGGSAVWADFDNDGYPDMFVYSTRRLFHNEAGREFTERSLPELDIASSQGACCGDLNGDGYVDIYIGGYEDWGKQITYPDAILMNQKGAGWVKSWEQRRYRARGVTACDFDCDGDLDIYVSNYRLQPNVLWVNDGRGDFTDEAGPRNAVATWKGFDGGHSIGAAWGDFDDDGLMDLFAGNFAHDDSRGHQPQSMFLRNRGAAEGYTFENKGQCGVRYQESYASPAAADFDNDGDVDLYFTTVYGTASFGRKNYPVLYRNDGGWSFSDVTAEAGVSGLGATYQASWADFDNDGDVDLLTAGRLFVNEGSGGNWLKVVLRGDGKTVNRDAIGSQVRIKLGQRTLTRQVEAGTGQGNQNEMTLDFGLGKWAEAVDLEILWAGGRRQTVKGVGVNRCITVTYASERGK